MCETLLSYYASVTRLLAKRFFLAASFADVQCLGDDTACTVSVLAAGIAVVNAFVVRLHAQCLFWLEAIKLKKACKQC